MIRYKRARPTPFGPSIIVMTNDDRPDWSYSFEEGTDEKYQEWLAAGNTPEPPDPLPEPVDPGPSLQERVEAAETLINLILDEEGE